MIREARDGSKKTWKLGIEWNAAALARALLSEKHLDCLVDCGIERDRLPAQSTIEKILKNYRHELPA